LESALGTETLNGISEQVGIDYDTATSATAYLVPHLVNDLTPNGKVPNERDSLSRIGGYLTEIGKAGAGKLGGMGAAGDTFDRVDASVGSAVNTGERTHVLADASVSPMVAGVPGMLDADDDGESNTALSWLLPLLILVLLLILGYWFCGGKSEPVSAPTINTNSANTNSTN
jgi:hypothetical protein